jgi:hypothetical protein
VHKGEKQDMDFNQLVRVWVDTNVNTHFIVSLPRISPVAELRGNVNFPPGFSFFVRVGMTLSSSLTSEEQQNYW